MVDSFYASEKVSTEPGQLQSGTGFKAYGNLYKTQEWTGAPNGSAVIWLDQKGSAFDALDREVVKYSYAPSSNTTLRSTAMTFDANAASLGMLASKTDPLGETISYTYDNAGHTIRKDYAGDHGVTPAVSFAYDADGRLRTATGAAYGTATTQYDDDGRVTEVDEPTAGAVTSPARLTYDYYPDGWRKALNVSSSALTAQPFISYSYRADGARSLVSWNQQGTQRFAPTYTDGGRLLSRSDPFTGMAIPSPQTPVAPGTLYAPTTRAYDTSGQLSTLGLPMGLTYSFITHNDEGHITGWTVNSSQGPVQMQLQESTRGENGSVSLSNQRIWSAQFANGAVIPANHDPRNPYDSLVDGVNSVVIGTTDTIMGTYSGDLSVCGQQTDLNGYDAAGRLVGKHLDITITPSSPGCDNQPADLPPGEATSYDAENHTVASTYAGCARYTPSGKPYQLGGCAGTGNTYTHFDGDQILFATDDNGVLVNAKLELLAEYAPRDSITVTDRDHTDFAATFHNAQTYYGTNFGVASYQSRPHAFNDPSPAYTTSSYFMGSSSAPSCALGVCGPNTPLQYTRPEGFAWGGLTIQGARATDSASGQWTTPDAYAGDIHDPMSRKSFMWDRNNPYEYSDPSGYCPQCLVAVPFAVGGLLELAGDGLILAGGAAAGVEIRDHGHAIIQGSNDALHRAGAAVGHAFDEARKHIPKGTKEKVQEEKGTRCIHCGQETVPESGSPNSHELDHDTPVSRGGSNDPSNLNPSCRTCNRKKGAKTNTEFGTKTNG